AQPARDVEWTGLGPGPRRLEGIIADGPLRAHLPAGAEQIVYEQHPDEVVQVLFIDREAAVSRFANSTGHVLGRQGDGEGDDVHPRRHDLSDHGVTEVL